MKRILLFIVMICCIAAAHAQVPIQEGGIFKGRGKRANATTDKTVKGNTRGSDSTKVKGANKLDTLGFEHRDDLKDSITISYRYLDSTVRHSIDSSINDWDKYYSVPSNYQYLGNNGAAAFPLVYKPFAKPGWDAGFHAFDLYRFKLEDTKFYRTTGPFSMLGFQLAGGKEQMIQALHTQSPKPNMNFGLDYRLISAPGYFTTQNNNENSIRLFGTYQGKRKRYAASLIVISNVIKASQNGGIAADSSLANPNYKERYSVPVNLGNALPFAPNPLNSSVKTGNIYKDFTFFLRQSYDVGKRDSVAINDSTTEYLFYPKLRAQHTLTYSTYSYLFKDVSPDTTVYKSWYNILPAVVGDTFSVSEKWKVMSNDFSLLQFPDTKNSAQYLLAGATLQNIQGHLKNIDKNFYNIFLHGEYRNRTRNKLWDVLLKGEFYLNGLNSGDYSAYATLSRYFNKKFGNINLYFSNVNRTPSFIFDDRSSFNLGNNLNLKKENITSFGATATNPYFQLSFNNYLITNYAYFYDYYHSDQYSKPINIIQVSGSKKIKITKRLNLYAEATVQQTDQSAPIKVPFIFTRSRLAYENNFYKNLFISTGLEVRYYTPYHANNYSPVIGQFTPQDTVTIKNLPDVTAFLNFRIKGFTAYIRAENLNTASFKNGFSFTNNNFAAPHYPTQGYMIRVGIRWWFVY